MCIASKWDQSCDLKNNVHIVNHVRLDLVSFELIQHQQFNVWHANT